MQKTAQNNKVKQDMVRSAYHGYQGVLNTSLGAGIRYGVYLEQSAEFIYNWLGGDGVPAFTPGAGLGSAANTILGNPVDWDWNYRE